MIRIQPALKISVPLFFCLLASLVRAQNPWQDALVKAGYGSNPQAGHYASIRGIRLYYEVYGSGEPLLLLHNNGGSIRYFSNNIPYFVFRNYQVIALDSRAQGKSPDPTDSLSYEMMADDAGALLDQLNIDSCNVIGWSDGGIEGLLLAMRHPEKVKKLAVSGANLWPDSTALAPFIYKWVKHDSDSLARLTPTPHIKNKSKLNNLMLKEPHISLAQLQAVRCPTLVIGGDYDAILPRHTLEIAEAIPNAYLWILPRAGHPTLIFHSDIFNQTVHDFFQKPYQRLEGWGRLLH